MSDNVISLVPNKTDGTKVYDYAILDIDDQEWQATGFLIFTSQHVCVMSEDENGAAMPVFLIPLNRVKVVELMEFIDDDDGESVAA